VLFKPAQEAWVNIRHPPDIVGISGENTASQRIEDTVINVNLTNIHRISRRTIWLFHLLSGKVYFAHQSHFIVTDDLNHQS